MSLILLIETGTPACSVALAQDGVVFAVKHLLEKRMQSKLLVPLIDQLLVEQQVRLYQCNAVAVSAGPGSYTGLRVGLSTAKGICFGSNLPLIAVNTLLVMAQNCIDLFHTSPSLPCNALIIPLMDARRMEVYCARYSIDGECISPTEAKIIDTNSFREELEQSPVFFTGDGVDKCRESLSHPNAHFVPLSPSAEGMRKIAHQAYEEKKFENLAYFEPFYFKEFMVHKK